MILPLQNGVDKKVWMERVLNKGVALDGCVYMATHIESPGVIKQSGGARKLIFGREPRDFPALQKLENLFRGAGINAELVEDIRLPVWTKYIMICSMAGATSFYREPSGIILADQEKKAFLEKLVYEVEMVARKKGVNYPIDIFTKTKETIASFPYHTKTSMQRDFESGKRTELEIFSGLIVRLSEELGVQTPGHRRVYEALDGK